MSRARRPLATTQIRSSANVRLSLTPTVGPGTMRESGMGDLEMKTYAVLELEMRDGLGALCKHD